MTLTAAVINESVNKRYGNSSLLIMVYLKG